MTNAADAVVWKADYDPFGKATVKVSTIENNLRFPGQYFDRETGLHYNYFRDYDPATGRYVEADPIGLEGGLNLYGYANQNPIMFTDPRGEVAQAIPILVMGAIIIAGGASSQQQTNGSKGGGGSIINPLGPPIDPNGPGINSETRSPPNFPNPIDCDAQLIKDYAKCTTSCGSLLTAIACKVKAEAKYWLCKKWKVGNGLSGMDDGF